jgi:hypothetical protein
MIVFPTFDAPTFLAVHLPGRSLLSVEARCDAYVQADPS